MKASYAMRVLGIGGASVMAVFCEWALARMMGGSAIAPPLAALGVTALMLALPFSWGLWLGLGAGFLLDSVGLPPFGATILLFIVIACAREIIRLVLAEQTSLLAKIVVAAGAFLLAYGAASLARAGAGLITFR